MDESTTTTVRRAGIVILVFLGIYFFIPLIVVAGLYLDLHKPSQLYPTYEELAKRGYYAYVIPPVFLEKYDWREEVFIWSWSRHCNLDTSTRNNPLRIRYFDSEDHVKFRIEISRWGLLEWGPFQPTIQIPFDPTWAKTGTLEMFERTYDDTKVIFLRYEDWYGTPVYIDSSLPLTETLTLLHLFNYEGAPPEVAEPWKRCENW